jgi:hypothetical protein
MRVTKQEPRPPGFRDEQAPGKFDAQPPWATVPANAPLVCFSED